MVHILTIKKLNTYFLKILLEWLVLDVIAENMQCFTINLEDSLKVSLGIKYILAKESSNSPHKSFLKLNQIMTPTLAH